MVNKNVIITVYAFVTVIILSFNQFPRQVLVLSSPWKNWNGVPDCNHIVPGDYVAALQGLSMDYDHSFQWSE